VSLATLADSSLDPRAAYEQLKSVQEIVKTIDSADILVDVLDRAKLAQEWLKVKNAAADVVVQATRVQLAALRRLGQLGDAAIELLPDGTPERKYAKRLASLTDARFEGELTDLEKPIRCSTFIQNIDHAHSYAVWLNTGYDIADGKVREPDELAGLAGAAARRHESEKPLTPRQRARKKEDALWEKKRSDNRVELMNQLLDQLYDAGDPFSVSAATDQMIEVFAEHEIIDFSDPRDNSGAECQIVREGVAASLRHALMDAAMTDEGGYESVYSNVLGGLINRPKFVTYTDPDVGWVRIPWHRAGLLQLQEMAAFRRRQVEELSASADKLTELVRILEVVAQRHPNETRVDRLFRAATRLNGGKKEKTA
jgi:hypothetical protein